MFNRRQFRQMPMINIPAQEGFIDIDNSRCKYWHWFKSNASNEY